MSVVGTLVGCGAVLGRAGNSSPTASWEACAEYTTTVIGVDACVDLGFVSRNELVEVLVRSTSIFSGGRKIY